MRASLAAGLRRPGAQEPTWTRAAVLSGAGFMANIRGDYAESRRLLERGLSIRRALGDRHMVAGSLSNLGVVVYNYVNLERYRWEAKDALAPGSHRIVFDFDYDGLGFGLGGRGTLTVDGKVADAKQVRKTLPFLFPEDETFDVGVDTRTPIDDRDYQVPFRFQGKLVKLTVDLHPMQGTLAEIIEFKIKTRD